MGNDEAKRGKRSLAGQIIERGPRNFLVRIYLGRDANGRRRYFNKQIRGSKRDAREYLNKALREKTLGVFVEPAAMFVNSFLDRWLCDVARNRVRESTFEDYSDLLRRFVRPALGDLRLCDVRAVDIQKLYGEMLDRGLSAASVRMAHAVFSSALKQAVKWDMLARNPCDSVELPRMERREMKAFAPEEASRFLASAREDKRAGVVLALALATGMRPEEYLALKWADIDLTAGSATVRRALVWRRGGGWYFASPKTVKSARAIPLPLSLTRDLAAHKRRQAEDRLRLGRDYEANDLVFATETGAPFDLSNLRSRHFRPALKRAGLSERFRLYDLRHSCATLLLAAGENPKVVSERLGHASITLTLDVYSHCLPSMQEAASQKLERILYG